MPGNLCNLCSISGTFRRSFLGISRNPMEYLAKSRNIWGDCRAPQEHLVGISSNLWKLQNLGRLFAEVFSGMALL